MNIGIVCFPTFGGSGISATELGLYLSKQGHQVHFIALKKPIRLSKTGCDDNLCFHQAKVIDYPLFYCQPYEFSLTNTIIEVATTYRLDILHVHYTIPHTSAAYVAKQALKEKGIDLKIITTIHGTEVTHFAANNICNPLISFGINSSDAITTVSKSLKEDALKYLDLSKDIHVLYNFINLASYNPSKEAAYLDTLGVDPSEDKILIHTSNFRAVKRVRDVIKIFYEVQKNISSKLLMIGDGPELDSCKTLAKDLGLMDKIFFIGILFKRI